MVPNSIAPLARTQPRAGREVEREPEGFVNFILRRCYDLIVRWICLIALCLACAGEQPAPLVVAIQPYGDVSEQIIEVAANALRSEYACEIVLLDSVSIPKSAYYEPRGRYRAEKLLDDLSGRLPKPATKIIGLTNFDISTTKGEHEDWGIFGLGSVGGKSCVVSTFRLKGPRLQERIRKVAVHEIGHTLGLPHCKTPQCVMQDAEGKVATVDAGRAALCDKCRSKI
jgi:archaemetzincin